MSDELYTLETCARKAGVSVSTIKREIVDRKLHALWIDNKHQITPEAWRQYLDSCRSGKFVLAQKEDYSDRFRAALSPSTKLYNGPAIYLLFQGTELVYVGRTKHLLERLAKHCKDKAFDGFSFVPCEHGELYRMELWAIKKYRPKLNLR